MSLVNGEDVVVENEVNINRELNEYLNYNLSFGYLNASDGSLNGILWGYNLTGENVNVNKIKSINFEAYDNNGNKVLVANTKDKINELIEKNIIPASGNAPTFGEDDYWTKEILTSSEEPINITKGIVTMTLTNGQQLVAETEVNITKVLNQKLNYSLNLVYASDTRDNPATSYNGIEWGFKVTGENVNGSYINNIIMEFKDEQGNIVLRSTGDTPTMKGALASGSIPEGGFIPANGSDDYWTKEILTDSKEIVNIKSVDMTLDLVTGEKIIVSKDVNINRQLNA